MDASLLDIQDPSDLLRWNDLQYTSGLDHIYKYTKSENAILLLTHKTLHFNSPIVFNDPFDCHPLLVKISDKFVINTLRAGGYSKLLSQRGFLHSQKFRSFLNDFSKTQQQVIETNILPNTKITCFTEKKDNLLMWSHYSSYHTGVCIEFCPKKLIIFLTQQNKTNASKNGIFLRVKYNDKRKNYLYQSSDDIYPLLMWLKTKSNDWAYEDEIRLLMTRWEENDLEIDPEIVTGIYLGNKIASNHEKEICLLAKSNFPHAILYKMELSKTEYELIPKKILS